MQNQDVPAKGKRVERVQNKDDNEAHQQDAAFLQRLWKLKSFFPPSPVVGEKVLYYATKPDVSGPTAQLE